MITHSNKIHSGILISKLTKNGTSRSSSLYFFALYVFQLQVILASFMHRCSFRGVHAKLIATDVKSNATFEVTIVNALPWVIGEESIFLNSTASSSDASNLKYLPLIRVDTQIDGLDPCTITEKTLRGDMSTKFNFLNDPLLLEQHHRGQMKEEQITTTTNSSTPTTTADGSSEDGPPLIEYSYNNGWIALLDGERLLTNCNGYYPFHLFYPIYATLFAQKLGAKSLFLSKRRFSTVEYYKASIPAHGFNYAAQTIYDQKIVIPAYIGKTSEVKFSNTVDYQWLVQYPLTAESNKFDPIYEPFGIYAAIHFSLGLISLGLVVYGFKRLPLVINHYRSNAESSNKNKVADATHTSVDKVSVPSTSRLLIKKQKAQKMALFIRLMVILPEILANLCRLFTSINPGGGFSAVRYGYILATVIEEFGRTTPSFVDIVTMIFCRDVYQIYKCSRNFEQATPFLIKYKFGGSLLCGIGVLQISLRVGFTYLSIIKNIPVAVGSYTYIYGIFYSVIVNAIVTSILLNYTSKMKKEVQGSIKLEASPNSTTGSSSATSKNAMYLLRIRKCITIAVYSRLVVAFTFLVMLSGWSVTSAFANGFCNLTVSISLLVGSSCQLYGAMILPPKKAIQQQETSVVRVAVSQLHQ